MEINNQKSIDLFNKRAELHKDYNSVLDAGDSKTAKHSNLLHDYFSKKYISENINPTSKDIILDYGCGVGRLTKYFKPKVKKIVGIDASTKMIEVAKTIYPEISNSFFSDIDDLPSHQYDVIFAHWVLAHMEDETIKIIFSNMKEKIKDNARLCMFEQTLVNEDTSTNNEVYKKRTIDDYKQLFQSIGYKYVNSKHVYRQPSYARTIWNRLPSSFKFVLPFLYWIEKRTLYRKQEFVEYYTTFMEFEKE